MSGKTFEHCWPIPKKPSAEKMGLAYLAGQGVGPKVDWEGPKVNWDWWNERMAESIDLPDDLAWLFRNWDDEIRAEVEEDMNQPKPYWMVHRRGAQSGPATKVHHKFSSAITEAIRLARLEMDSFDVMESVFTVKPQRPVEVDIEPFDVFGDYFEQRGGLGIIDDPIDSAIDLANLGNYDYLRPGNHTVDPSPEESGHSCVPEGLGMVCDRCRVRGCTCAPGPEEGCDICGGFTAPVGEEELAWSMGNFPRDLVDFTQDQTDALALALSEAFGVPPELLEIEGVHRLPEGMLEPYACCEADEGHEGCGCPIITLPFEASDELIDMLEKEMADAFDVEGVAEPTPPFVHDPEEPCRICEGLALEREYTPDPPGRCPCDLVKEGDCSCTHSGCTCEPDEEVAERKRKSRCCLAPDGECDSECEGYCAYERFFAGHLIYGASASEILSAEHEIGDPDCPICAGIALDLANLAKAETNPECGYGCNDTEVASECPVHARPLTKGCGCTDDSVRVSAWILKYRVTRAQAEADIKTACGC